MATGARYEAEVHEQPLVLAGLLERGRGPAEALAAQVRARDPAYALLAARGSSDNAARYAQYLWGARNRLTVALAAPSLFTLYRAPPRLAGAFAVGISQSGQSPDVVAVLEEARRQGCLTAAVTNDPASPLGRAALACLALGVGEERAVAATKTYTAQLFALALLSAALEGEPGRWEELARLPGQLAEALRLNAGLDAARLRGARQLVALGRGYNYATAHELALKLKETCYLPAEPYSTADFRHGPMALLEPGLPVLLVAPSSVAQADADALLAELLARGAEPVVISDRPELLARAALPLPLPPGVPEHLSPLVAVAAGQLLALALARLRGADPDAPRGLSKVTLTR